MRWPVKPPRPPAPEWRRCYALLPRVVGGTTWVWLEWLERRVLRFGVRYVVYEYRLPA